MKRGLKGIGSRSRMGAATWGTLLGGLFVCCALLAGFALAPALAP